MAHISFNRLNADELSTLDKPKATRTPSARHQETLALRESLSGLNVGEGAAVPLEGETAEERNKNRANARNRIRSAAKAVGLEIEFLGTRGSELVFKVTGQVEKATGANGETIQYNEEEIESFDSGDDDDGDDYQ